jgi:DNA-binding transcriptional ArsR family regulator
MAKNKLLLLDLGDKKTKKLAETITSDTSRKILEYLADQETAPEAKVAKELNIPISTVHYHLQKLVEAGLVLADEFTYSTKGREINQYKLANKYIIIAPKKVTGIKNKLKSVLPVLAGILGISAVIKIIDWFGGTSGAVLSGANKATFAVEEAAMDMAEEASADAAPRAVEIVADTIPTVSSSPDIALWFLVGGLSAVLLYVVVVWIMDWRSKR